ncbi:P-loop containing nucleoside triphosphate hydrolase protein [Mycena floridula]|nr:P-loop containing nucleoside triphosphate hydrolase protein [Mycena floridula]
MTCSPYSAGLYDYQLELVSLILDGESTLFISATADGKSVAFSITILVLLEYNQNPDRYPVGLRTSRKPIGIVVCPTQGLETNIVFELTKLGLSAFSYSTDNLAECRRNKIPIASLIKECEKWQIICVSPERLGDAEWREIVDYQLFRDNVIFGIVDEVHLINEWGLDFRIAFSHIGIFLRGRFPSRAAIVGLTATLQPGPATTAVCRNSFPDLLPFLNSGRKTIIHVQSIDLLFRIYRYCFSLDPTSSLKRVRMYHAVLPASDNVETIQLMNEDPDCQIIIGTIAIANGMNVKTLLDSISVDIPKTLDCLWQEKGHVGRDPKVNSRGIILMPKGTIARAEKFIAGMSSFIVSSIFS